MIMWIRSRKTNYSLYQLKLGWLISDYDGILFPLVGPDHDPFYKEIGTSVVLLMTMPNVLVLVLSFEEEGTWVGWGVLPIDVELRKYDPS